MRAIMLMFDTLTKNFLPNYGCDFTIMPNFKRLEEKCTTFDEFYGGSMPCMPARRELHTGQYNFLHRGWGPLEPYDVSCIEKLKNNGVYTHLITDHSHYWEDGGATYHGRYNSCEFFRGQEGDRWVPQGEADKTLNTCPLNKTNVSAVQHLANRRYMVNEEDMPGVQTVNAGVDFLQHYHDKDSWFLQVECFDPHEPFYVPDKYRELYDCCDSHDAFNFPAYTFVGDKYTEEEIQGLRKEYYALLSMCDAQLGKILDTMDAYDMWKDTMLIVNTDHGFFLGEHDFIGKNVPPVYEEMIHIPFFIHLPDGQGDGERRSELAQTIDIAPTLLEYFDLEPLQDIDGCSLLSVVKDHQKIHDTALFGVHGGQINLFDGKYVYMKSGLKDKSIYNMTLMPTLMRGFISPEAIDQATFVNGGKYSHGHKVLQVPSSPYIPLKEPYPDAVYNLTKDPKQEHNILNEDLQTALDTKLKTAMLKAGAPSWQMERMGFTTYEEK